MNALNSIVTKVFDLALLPIEWMGAAGVLIACSGVFGILALIAFKHISWQQGIKRTKDRIKGHLIEIRIYQNDLVVVARSVAKILFRNFQYLALNFGPFVPLAIPFVLVMAQFVVRYAFDPIPVVAADARPMAGEGTLVEIQLTRERARDVAGLEVELPEGLRAVSPLVRVPDEGRAFLEVVGARPGEWDILLRLADGSTATKSVVTGDVPSAVMQPERVADFWSAWLWPAEATFESGSPFQRVSFPYPDRDLGWMPGGILGILIVFVVASMAFGVAVLKPLGVQI